jgi:hypothetical protein
MMTRTFNGMKDDMELADKATDAMVKIKTRTHDAARRLAGV